MVRNAILPQQRQHPEAIRIAAITASILANAALFMFLMTPQSYSPPVERDDTRDIKMVDIYKKPIEVPVTPAPPTPPQPQPIPVHVTQKTPVPPPIDVPRVVTSDPGPVDIPVPPQPQPGPQNLGGDIGPPQTLQGASLSPMLSPAPAYPIDALRDGITGTVQLELLVGVDGHVLEARVVHSSGDRRLDAAARDQVLRNWLFTPAVENGVRVQALGRLPVVFTLGGR